ncbi:MAG: VWA domain-containing protein [Candidatus Hydrogenedentes bacterium]|nr:VWA domain-containing protein [Candidatus Hydrogenedentota bacterium]
MSTQNLVTCKCGAVNTLGAIQCHQCGEFFDGSAGNSIPFSRRMTKTGSVRFSGEGNAVSGRSHYGSKLNPVELWQPPQRNLVAQNTVKLRVAIITFSANAELRAGPAHPSQIPPFELHPDGSTNEEAGLTLAGNVWQQQLSGSRLNVIVFGDGVATTGGGWFCDPGKAALDIAKGLKQQKARVATIGFRGPSMDFNHLRALASSPALAWEAQAGNVTPIFLTATQSMTSNRWGQYGAEFVAFVIDESGSMDEANKKAEVEAAVNASIEFLRNL